MARTWMIAGGLVLTAATPVFAEPQSSLPRTIASAGVTQTEWQGIEDEARRQARRAGVSEAALLAAAEAAGVNLAASGHFNALTLQQAIVDQLSGQADQIAELQQRLDALTGDADPAIASIFSEARAALNAGRLAEADTLLAQIAVRDLAAIQAADAEALRRRLRASETMAARGQVAQVQADYLAAAAHFARAAETAPQASVEVRWRYRIRQANALYERGKRFNDSAPLGDAIRIYDTLALPLAPRDARPEDWAGTLNELGNALLILGERGDETALTRSIRSFEDALTAINPQAHPNAWARTQMNFGNALSRLGERGDDAALMRAIAAYEAALAISERGNDRDAQVDTLVNLGGALYVRGERGDDAALARSAQVFKDALDLLSREQRPAAWAAAQNNYGVALRMLGERGDEAAFGASVQAFEQALLVRTRESDPAGWAETQYNLAQAYLLIGLKGDQEFLRRALAAHRAALEVYTRANAPTIWGKVQNGFGGALLALGQRGEGANQGLDFIRQAVAAHRTALEVFSRNVAPHDWALTQQYLGDALVAQSERGEPQALDAAIIAYRSALEMFDATTNPMQRAMVQSGLGYALSQLGARADLAAVTEAVALHRDVLQVYTRERSPPDWAMAQNCLGLALRWQGMLGNARAFDEAERAFRAALEVWTEADEPAGWAFGNFNLAVLDALRVERGAIMYRASSLRYAHIALSGFERVGDAYQADRARQLIALLEQMGSNTATSKGLR